MKNNRETKREALRTRLIDAAEEEISALGLAGLKARNVTQKAGCALGALYNAVSDLDGLVILVNSRTIKRLDEKLSQASDLANSPEETLQALATAYVDFALSQENLWFAAFNHRLPDGNNLPEWHQAEYLELIGYLAKPLSQLLPDLSPDACTLRALTLFASVHGVVQMSINGQFAGAPRDALPSEVEGVVGAISRGLMKK